MKKNYNFEYFLSKPWSFVLIKNGAVIYKSKKQGLRPLVFCAKKRKKEMMGATVFDKVVGRAAALLLVYAKVKEIWTLAVSRAAKTYLTKNKIKVAYKKEVKCILNRKGDDLCPMEKKSRKKGAKAEDFLEIIK